MTTERLAALLHEQICEYHWPDLMTCGIDHDIDARHLLAAGVRVAPSPDAPDHEPEHWPHTDGSGRWCDACSPVRKGERESAALPPRDAPGLRERIERMVDGRENDETMTVEVSALWSLLDAALPPRDALDVERVPLAYPQRADGKAIEHEDACAFAYGNTTYPCRCFVLAAQSKEPTRG